MLLPRALTAIVGIPVLLGLLLRGGLAYDAFVLAVIVLCLYEYGLILRMGGRRIQRVGTVAWGAALALCLAFGGPLPLALSAAVGAMVLRELFDSRRTLEGLALGVFGIVFLGVMLSHLALLRGLGEHGAAFSIILFIAVWVMDSAAYGVGRAFGSRPLARDISPKKTWEGAAAGFAGAVAVAWAGGRLLPIGALPTAPALGLGVLIGVCGQLSDLAESMVKRAVGVKDSGCLLPGHGGVMDRFDSFILGAPAVYYYLQWVTA